MTMIMLDTYIIDADKVKILTQDKRTMINKPFYKTFSVHDYISPIMVATNYSLQEERKEDTISTKTMHHTLIIPLYSGVDYSIDPIIYLY